MSFWKVRSYTPWGSNEEEALRLGVRKFGLGAWHSILLDPEFSALVGRNGIQLKDKWRNLVKFRHVSREEADLAVKTASRAAGVTKKVSRKRAAWHPARPEVGSKAAAGRQQKAGDNSSESEQVAMAVTDVSDNTDGSMGNGPRVSPGTESQATTSEIAGQRDLDHEVQSRCTSARRPDRSSATGCGAEAGRPAGEGPTRQGSCCESYEPAPSEHDEAMERVATATELAREAYDIQLEANRQLSAIIEAIGQGVPGMAGYMEKALQVAQTASERAKQAYQKLHEVNTKAFGPDVSPWAPPVAADPSPPAALPAINSDDSCDSEDEKAAAEALIIALHGHGLRTAEPEPGSKAADDSIRLSINADELQRWASAVEAARIRRQKS